MVGRGVSRLIWPMALSLLVFFWESSLNLHGGSSQQSANLWAPGWNFLQLSTPQFNPRLHCLSLSQSPCPTPHGFACVQKAQSVTVPCPVVDPLRKNYCTLVLILMSKTHLFLAFFGSFSSPWRLCMQAKPLKEKKVCNSLYWVSLLCILHMNEWSEWIYFMSL